MWKFGPALKIPPGAMASLRVGFGLLWWLGSISGKRIFGMSSRFTFRPIVVLGPTASGKTAFCHRLSQSFAEARMASEIVNLDAFQIYQGVTAGTAKPNETEITEFKYHGIDVLKPFESLDAREFARRAHEWCAQIASRGAVPLCLGGSGLYLRAFLHGLDELPQRDDFLRTFFRENASQHSWPFVHNWLQALDPVRAAEVHPNDGVRIERALEIYFLTGALPSGQRSLTQTLDKQECLFDCHVLHMDVPEGILKERIRTRVDLLFGQGWLEEVTKLRDEFGIEALRSWPSMRAIGYSEVLDYIEQQVMGKIREQSHLFALKERISTLTWQYAKRQMTWNAKERSDGKLSADAAGVLINEKSMIEACLHFAQ
jgi:tRNA dimethylallyltransferase